jgi:hypothetical protein
MPRVFRMQSSILVLGLIGTAIVYWAVSGGSLWPPLIICALCGGGAVTLAWWFGKKTGLTREWERLERVRASKRESERAEER